MASQKAVVSFLSLLDLLPLHHTFWWVIVDFFSWTGAILVYCAAFIIFISFLHLSMLYVRTDACNTNLIILVCTKHMFDINFLQTSSCRTAHQNAQNLV